jgi:diguanylate cyclase (GGDEF)-like protein/PAS domain S-box-containing protein
MTWTPAARLSFGLVVLTSCILLIGDLVGLTPGRSTAILEARKQLCETLAVQYALDAQHRDWQSIRVSMQRLLKRNDSLLSAGLRASDGTLLVHVGDHKTQWVAPPDGKSTPTHAQVPIFSDNQLWGTVELTFQPLVSSSILGVWRSAIGRFIFFVALLGFVAYLLFMRRALHYLDPSAVIPARVQAVLETLAEGVILLDLRERIVLANTAFANRLGRAPEKLIGIRPSELEWRTRYSGAIQRPNLPWVRSLRRAERCTATTLFLQENENEPRAFVVNTAPILDERGIRRGALATFDDITELEEKKEALERALAEVRKSQAEIRMQNEELQVLATLDPLSGCLNRRSFLERFERELASARESGTTLHCLMADIDHFKAVNDSYGHGIGDRVIEVVAAILGARLRSSDAICRWGGEEFCILLVNRDWSTAQAEAEFARRRVEGIDHDAASLPEGLQLSVSIGMASLETQPETILQFIDQADRAMYSAKKAGRNRVILLSRGGLEEVTSD